MIKALINIAGYLGLALTLIGFVLKTPKAFKLCMASGTLMWALQALIRGDLGAAAAMGISGVRQGSSAWVIGLAPRQKALACAFFVISTLLLFCKGYANPWSVAILASALLGCYSFLYANNLVLRWCVIAGTILYLIYAFGTHNPTMVLSYSLDLVALSIGLIRVYQSKAFRTQ